MNEFEYSFVLKYCLKNVILTSARACTHTHVCQKRRIHHFSTHKWISAQKEETNSARFFVIDIDHFKLRTKRLAKCQRAAPSLEVTFNSNKIHP